MKATTRFALLAAMLVVIPAMIVGVILYQANRAHMVAEEQARMAFAMHQAAKDLRDAATDARAKVDFLAGTPPVAILPRLRIEGAADPSDVRAQQKVWKDRLTQIFLALAKTSPDIMQIRLIEAAHDGQELVRVNRDGASVVAIPEADLQQKGDQPYAVQTLAAPPGDVLMFDINLNREHGQIEVPHVPVLRVSTPIYGPSGTAYGLIVINVDMRGVFARMRSHFLSGVNFYLANAAGNYLVHPDPSKAFAFEFGDAAGLDTDFPEFKSFFESAESFAERTTDKGDGPRLVQLARLGFDPARPNHLYMGAAMIPEATLFDEQPSRGPQIIGITAVLALIGVILAILLTRWLVRPLDRLTEAAIALAHGATPDSVDIPTHRKDEVGVLARAFRGMAEALADRQAHLEEKEARIRAILEAAGNPIVTIDGAGTIYSANPATTRLFGYARDELIGANVKLLMTAADARNHDKYLNDFHLSGRAAIIGVGREVRGRRKDGSIVPIHLAVSRMRLKDRVMFTGVMTDMSAQKRIDRLKNEFVSTVSHELRTPLTSIKGALGLLQGRVMGALPEEIGQMIGIAHSNSERLARLIDDILDIEKIEAGKLSFRPRPIAVGAFLDHMIAAAQGQATAAGVKLVKRPLSAPMQIEADPDRLAQVVGNLLSNAIKFSPTGSTVTLAARQRREGVRIIVADSGPGIAEEFRDKMFAKFAQADGSDTRQRGGTGLGLAISKAIVEAHGGHIGFRTRMGKGTLIYFDLPQNGAMNAAAA